jgi:hypothetical protein
MRFRLLAYVVVAVAIFDRSDFISAAAPNEDKPQFSAEQITYFEKHVRPLLAAKCVECHGPKLAEAGLRLDSRGGVLHGMEGSPAAVPGDPAKSRLIAVVKYDGDVQMPPDGKLADEQLAVLTNWVKLGLPWPEEVAPAKPVSAKPNIAAHEKSPWSGSMDERIARARAEHWAFQPVKRVEPPQIGDPAWNRNPVDRFVAARLAAAKLSSSPEADPATLIRRLYFDLIGLPPSASEVEAFVRNYSPETYAALVDELLASPRYGERWARHWLDVARYSDTKGYAFQQERRYPFAYTYRDYVIRAFNEDLPYDQFILEQLAADKLPPREDNRYLAALGFITCGRIYQGMHDTLDDQIDVVTRGFLGLTAACARCHDHKFDPIPTDDYYSLYGVFRSSTTPAELPLIGKPTPGKEYDAFVAELAKLDEARQKFFDEQAAKLKEELRANAGDYLAKIMLERHEGSSAKEAEFLFDAGDPRPPVVRRWRDWLEATKRNRDPVFAPWHALDSIKGDDFAASAQKLIAEWGRGATIGKEKIAVNRAVLAMLAKSPPKSMLDVAAAYGDAFSAAHDAWKKLIDEKNKANVAEPERLADADIESLRQVLYGDRSPTALSVDDIRSVFDRKVRNEYEGLKKKAEEFVVMSPAAPPRAMVLNDLPQLFNPRVFLRGDASRPEREVPRQFPRILTGDDRKPFADGSGRLGLAQAIASKENPLTARVMVNRIWLLHFGRGLVDTPSDFGVRTPPPTHPELLDYLAAQFMDEGWSVKRLHRWIVTSQTYKQASHTPMNPTAKAVDPENRLLWRMNRRRLELEPMRDAMLAVAGRLDVTPFGRPVELWSAPFTTRRTVYGFIDRQDLPGIFGVFDFANPDVTIDQRPRTTVPQQALFAMNSPFVLEQARYLAKRPEIAGAKNDAIRVESLYRAVLGRRPEADESARVLQFLEELKSAPKLELRSPWQYGYGEFDLESKKQKSFTPFAHFAGKSWQAGPKIPDAKLGHASLGIDNSHPGHTAKQAVVIRWTSPMAGRVSIAGLLKHPSKDGDGVTAHVVSSRLGELGKWTAQKSNAETKVAAFEVRVGDVIDLVVEPRSSDAYDSYKWNPVLKAEKVETSVAGAVSQTTWGFADDFQGPLPPPQTPWEMLAQVLLMSNEFMFVD